MTHGDLFDASHCQARLHSHHSQVRLCVDRPAGLLCDFSDVKWCSACCIGVRSPWHVMMSNSSVALIVATKKLSQAKFQVPEKSVAKVAVDGVDDRRGWTTVNMNGKCCVIRLGVSTATKQLQYASTLAAKSSEPTWGTGGILWNRYNNSFRMAWTVWVFPNGLFKELWCGKKMLARGTQKPRRDIWIVNVRCKT